MKGGRSAVAFTPLEIDSFFDAGWALFGNNRAAEIDSSN